MRKSFLYSVLISMSLFSCTKNFEDYNEDPNRLTVVGARERPFMFAKAQSSASMNRSFYQTVQNLGADLYSQYFALTTTSFRTDRYALTPDWQRRFWTVVYVDTAPQLLSILESVDEDSGEAALANIMWVYAFHRLADHFGPIPYFDAAKADGVIAYDPLDEIYDDFFKRLTKAVEHLKALPQGTKIYEGYDLMYNGDVQNWIVFANSLRLRLALRISKVNSDKAKVEAEAAVASGVMLNNNQNASVAKALSGNDTNGLSQVAVWNEFAMSSTIASYLKGYDDPRLSIYFQPSIATSSFNSVRNGLSSSDLGDIRNQAVSNSNVGKYWVSHNGQVFVGELTARLHVMAASESYFLRAEGALNGWNMGGTAQLLYESGIKMSMEQWGVQETEALDYIQSSLTPTQPDDFHNSPAVSNIGVAWSSTISEQREQVGVQKWIAIFPNGMEAWAEFRRSGYPKMYDLLVSENPDLPVGTFIKRLPYPLTEETNNLEELTKGRALLGGEDNAATRLWWDVD
ncbi:SusD/RagB family nutrient-binding outer membrane lipoprotein [Sphingobacterium sp. UT-1RO-CII-1]|uniref:SusD/RagB family nutrient-binding outer membrane lipoprotein n=1 Tax=Sphingobacterium sp. UT-1RO-CII-1 TaxID=2995225 RepID=UPI00227BC888|nr:SusD/RagB family nutrient-binding outer membrane lipoprotein [Sphingobacterium sp. UT-1RO-CII-1]MCY4780653.1 SusD/RagB family nutrient-binding outer membrane lipoprotein [Sphingobacterium sp. UT-1RO-CII-1]